MTRRRVLQLALGAGLASGSAMLRAQAVSAGPRRVGVLAPSTRAKEEVTLKPFFDGMRELGWIEGQNIAYDRVYADDRHDRLPSLAAELVARGPELIFAPPTPAAIAAKGATRTIPIVFGAAGDPVGVGLVAALARPGGNVTGISNQGAALTIKPFDVLRELLPNARRIGSLGDPTDPATQANRRALASIAAPLGLSFIDADVTSALEFDAVLTKLLAARVDAIYTFPQALIYNLRARLIERAMRSRVPVIATRPVMADDGALFAYGSSLAGQLRRSASVADRILKGTAPGDIPVEEPTVFELAVNLKTAKALGIAVPQAILLRADRVIE